MAAPPAVLDRKNLKNSPPVSRIAFFSGGRALVACGLLLAPTLHSRLTCRDGLVASQTINQRLYLHSPFHIEASLVYINKYFFPCMLVKSLVPLFDPKFLFELLEKYSS